MFTSVPGRPLSTGVPGQEFGRPNRSTHWEDNSCIGRSSTARRDLDKEGRKEMFWFYLRLYGVGHMVKDHSDSERGNPLPPHRLLFPISSKGSFICIILQTG